MHLLVESKLDKERRANKRRRTTNGYIARRSKGEIHNADLKKSRLTLDEIRLNLSRAEIQREELDQHIKFASNALFDAKMALEKDEAARKEKELKEKIVALSAELTLLRQRKKDATSALDKEREDAKKLEKLLHADEEQIPPHSKPSSRNIAKHPRRETGHATRNIAKHPRRGTQHASLATEVTTSHPAARAFVDLLLRHYTKCDTLTELRDHRTAITRECFVRRNYTDSHLNPRYYRRWFIGERATMSQIENRQRRLDELADEMVSFNEGDAALRERLALTNDKMRPLIELENMLEGTSALSACETEYDELRAALEELDLDTAKTLKAKVEKAQREYNRLLGQARQKDGEIGGMKAEEENLSGERIPRLEGEIDQSIQKAEDFLITEDVDGEFRADIEKEYARRLERQPVNVIHENSTRYEGDYQTAETRNRDRLRDAKQAYSMRYDFGYDNEDHADNYLAEREKLVNSELPQYEEQIAKQRALAEEELVENFIHRLREQIQEARQQLAYLNKTLANLRFSGERYEFTTQPANNLREMYAMVMDSQKVLGASLFDSDFRQKHQQAWDLLLERLTLNNQLEADLSKELRELQDYRSYLQYDIRIHYPNGDRAILSKINTKKSGGETTTPFYVSMAASFAQAYRINQPRPSDTIRLALFDEAFGKMDTARTASALQFMRDAGLQVILATPPDKSGALLPYVDTVCTVVRKNNHAFVIEVDKSEILEELDGE